MNDFQHPSSVSLYLKFFCSNIGKKTFLSQIKLSTFQGKGTKSHDDGNKKKVIIGRIGEIFWKTKEGEIIVETTYVYCIRNK